MTVAGGEGENLTVTLRTLGVLPLGVPTSSSSCSGLLLGIPHMILSQGPGLKPLTSHGQEGFPPASLRLATPHSLLLLLSETQEAAYVHHHS